MRTEWVGYLDVDGWRAHLATTGETLHVFLDGEDVTWGSFRAIFFEDGIHGNVWRYRRNAEGRYYRLPGTETIAVEVITGELTITPGEPFR